MKSIESNAKIENTRTTQPLEYSQISKSKGKGRITTPRALHERGAARNGGGSVGVLFRRSKFLSIVCRARMDSTRDNEIYTGSGLRGVIPYVQCRAVVFPC
jgi:hypothetical protein